MIIDQDVFDKHISSAEEYLQIAEQWANYQETDHPLHSDRLDIIYHYIHLSKQQIVMAKLYKT